MFANPNGLFTPGMFARVRVPGSPPYEACWCRTPPSAPSRRANIVLVVGAENTRAATYVTLGQATSDGLRVIKDGLGPDDRVIVNGLMRARPGRR